MGEGEKPRQSRRENRRRRQGDDPRSLKTLRGNYEEENEEDREEN